jgi:ParB/RepB/Spo0J family partition protein
MNMDTQMEEKARVLPASGYASVSVALLHGSDLNHRKAINKEKLDELTASIKAQGILENLVVRPIFEEINRPAARSAEALESFEPGAAAERGPVIGYEVIAGNRRWQAALEAGTEEAPVVIKDLTDDQAREVMLVENLQREDVHPLEECRAYAELAKTYTDLEVLAGRVGKKPTYVRLRLQLNNLIKPVEDAFWRGKIHLEHALEISRLAREEQQLQTLKACMESWRGLFTVRELKDYIQSNFYLNLAEAPFDTADATLVPAAGACITCPKRTGANTLLFPDIKVKDTCTDPPCFQNKVSAHIKWQKAKWAIEHAQEPMVELSTAYGKPPAGVLGRDKFRIVKGRDSKGPDVKHGIVVSGEDLGQVVAYIEVHGGSAAAASRPLSERKSLFESRAKELDTKRMNEEDAIAITVLMNSIDPASLTVEELQHVAHECVARCYHDMLKRYSDRLFGEIKDSNGIRDYVGATERRAKEVVKDPKTLAWFLMELMLFNHIGHLRESNEFSKGNSIYLLAKKRKVSFDKVFAPLQEKYDERKARSAARAGVELLPKQSPEKKTTPKKSGKSTKKAAKGKKTKKS